MAASWLGQDLFYAREVLLRVVVKKQAQLTFESPTALNLLKLIRCIECLRHEVILTSIHVPDFINNRLNSNNIIATLRHI